MVVLPLWSVSDQNKTAGDLAGMSYQTCVTIAEHKPGYDAWRDDQPCWAEFNKQFARFKATWADYGAGLFFTAVMCVVAYALLACCAWVARWVWRGRSIKNTASE